MTKDEELFRKYCPDFCAGGECLEPYFSLFQAGMDMMRDGMDQLQEEIAGLRSREYYVGDLNRKLCDQQLKIEVLENENKRLQEQVVRMRRCENCRYKGQISNCTYKYYARCAMECKSYSLWEAAE